MQKFKEKLIFYHIKIKFRTPNRSPDCADTGCFVSCFTDKRQSDAPLDVLSALSRTPRVEVVNP